MTENDLQDITKLRISVVERIVPMIAFALAVIGGGITAFLLQQAFSALQNAESAGVAAVAGGTAEANVAVLTGLYLGILVGFVALGIAVLRMFTAKKRASPPGLFYLLPGLIALLPAALVWYVESLVIDVLRGAGSSESGGMAGVAPHVGILLNVAVLAVPITVVILALLAFFPFTARAGGKIGPTIVLLIMDILFIATAMAFQYRTIFLYQLI